ncbi:MAG: NAD(P)H-dependent oxidoreductase [Nevskia sp.]|nr:NAD(P)H-dependent oxidoreductase [Nevskia sp.]
MKHLLVIYSSQTGRTRSLLQAACDGAGEFADEVELRLRPALEAGVEDLLWADGLLIGTPENFGYMSGAVKDFLDRVYYPTEGRKLGMPYAVLVSAGNDGSGAVRAIERIATGGAWTRIAEPVVVKGEPDGDGLGRCRELGQTFAAGLACGIF